MTIIGTLPNTISNGQAVDATPVMADFNFIVNQVNANAVQIGTLAAPSGTRVIFQQASAPLGWTADATLTDHTLQLTAAGGTIFSAGLGYSGMFNAQWTTDGHALTQAELAAHVHGVTDPTHTHGSPAHTHNTPSGFNFWTATSTGGASTNFSGGASSINQEAGTGSTAVTINAASTGISIQSTGSGSAHTHTKTFNANFAQGIVGVKS
jgi:hypothetical protein